MPGYEKSLISSCWGTQLSPSTIALWCLFKFAQNQRWCSLQDLDNIECHLLNFACYNEIDREDHITKALIIMIMKLQPTTSSDLRIEEWICSRFGF